MAESRNVSLRKLLDLYVYVLPLKSFPGIQTRFGDLDLVMIRQNSEGEYLMLEHEPVQGSVECLKVVTRYNTRRLAEYAYEYAVQHKRKRMTVIHTADIHPLTEGLFLDVALEVSQDYPGIETNVQQAGRMILDVMKDPRQFDVVLATNLNGGIVSNVLNGMLGGPALSAGINLNGDGLAVFEPGIRNKGSGIVGKGVANPTAMLMAAVGLRLRLGSFATPIKRNACRAACCRTWVTRRSPKRSITRPRRAYSSTACSRRSWAARRPRVKSRTT